MPLPPSIALTQAQAADPLEKSWGLYLAPASGEGDSLAWFATVAELQAFVAGPLWEALAGVGPGPDTAAELAELFQGAPALTWDLLDQLNLRLEPVAQVHWWGNLRQLYEGEDPFAKDLREAWRQGVGRGPQDFSALSPDDAREFSGFLRSTFNAG